MAVHRSLKETFAVDRHFDERDEILGHFDEVYRRLQLPERIERRLSSS